MLLESTATALRDAIKKALALKKRSLSHHRDMVVEAMKTDFSWVTSAKNILICT